MKSRDSSSAVLSLHNSGDTEGRRTGQPDHRQSVSPGRTHSCLTGDPYESPVILAAGRGLQTAPCFEKMLTLADALGGQAVGTRGVLDLGWLPWNREVGLSGLRLTPEIYLGFGVSGANFHTIGMYRSEWILAVNTDERARIFRLADFCVHADTESVLDWLLESLPPEPFSSTKEIRAYVTRCAEKFPYHINTVRRND